MTLAIHDRQETQLAQSGPIGNPIAAMLQTIIQGNITSDTAATMEKLTELYLKVEADNARKAFASAKIQLQSEMPRVFASRIIPDNNGKTRSVFAAYEDIMKVVQPMLVKHGFSVSFTSRIDDSGKAERLCVLCKLSHCDGHSETNEFAVRVSKPPGASEAQGDGSTHSYAKRYALCDALNITIDKDNDARIEGDYITPDEARELEERVMRCKSDPVKFLKFAMAESFATIRAERLRFLHDMLDQKERQHPAPPASETPATDPTETWPATKAEAWSIAQAKNIDPDILTAACAHLEKTLHSMTSTRRAGIAARSEWLNKLANGAKLKADGTFA